jgi:hypothetical protein
MLLLRLLVLVLLPAFAVPLAAAPKAALTEAEAKALAVEVSAAVESLRGLKFKRPVAVKLVDDAAARKHFQSRLDRFWPPDQAALEQKAQAQLGLLPPGTDVVQSLLDLLEEQAGGYYDPASDTFFILTDMPKAAAPILFAHELTHALDDQHLDLDARLMNAVDDDDRGTTVGAIIEGSGMLVMTAYMIREQQAGRLGPEAMLELAETQAGQAEKLTAAPPLMQRLLLAPYLLGLSFLTRGNVFALATGVPVEDLNRVFAEPPASTEQLLHPEKYWNAAQSDPPRAVDIPDLSARLGPGWTRKISGVLGELSLAILTGSGAIDPRSMDPSPGKWTSAGAAGWDGDRYHYYEGPKGSATVLATVWDSPQEAEEFEASLTAAAPKVRQRRGSHVVLVAATEGVPAETLAAAALDAVAPPPAGKTKR